MANELPINVNQTIEDIEEDIREYGSITLPSIPLHTTIITAAKMVVVALDRETAAINNQTSVLEAALDRQTVQFTIIAEMQTLIETYQKKLKELGEADGIHWRRPNEFLTGAASFEVQSNSVAISSNSNRRKTQVSIKNVNESYNENNSEG